MSISNYAENALLDTLRNVSFTVASTYVKLHLGDPGEDGTNNAAAETTRQAATWSAASGGSIATSGTVEWTNVSTTEIYTHWSLWDASTAGNCLWTGALGASASMTAGDTFQITSLTLSLD
ncbi:MAG: phage tail fiber protein [Pontimonas sp.]|jgi:hypothetical protein